MDEPQMYEVLEFTGWDVAKIETVLEQYAKRNYRVIESWTNSPFVCFLLEYQRPQREKPRDTKTVFPFKPSTAEE